MKEHSRFLSLLLVIIAFLLNGCSIALNENNKKYAFYTTEFENKTLVGPSDELTYSGSQHQINGQTTEYIFTGVFSDKRNLRILIPNTARGKEIKSSKSADDFMIYCLNQTNEHAVLDVTSAPVASESSFVRFKSWPNLYDHIYPKYSHLAREVTPKEVIVYFNVYAGISGVVLKRQSDGELVFIPLESGIEWKKRSRSNLFMRRSAYIITIPLDIVASPIYFLIMMTKGVG